MMSADFSKLLAHIHRNLVEHAKRDGLDEVQTAIFLSRGRHAPGEVCPTAATAEQSSDKHEGCTNEAKA